VAERSPWGRLRDELRAGLRLVGESRVLSAVFLSLGIGLLGEGTFEVGFPPLVLDVFAGGASGAGIILSAQAVGGLIAGALVARAGESIPPRILYGGGLIGLGLADLGTVNATAVVSPGMPAVALASFFMVLAGFPVVALNAAAQGILQRETLDAFRGRVFGALSAVQGVSMLAGLGLGALVIDRVGVVAVLSAGAAMWIVAGALALARLPGDAGRLAPNVAEGASA
jgi:MFS family permease